MTGMSLKAVILALQLTKSAYKKCQLQAVTGTRWDVPDLSPPKLMDIHHDQADLPSSSNPVPVPENETCATHPDSRPPLRRSTRKRSQRQILDLLSGILVTAINLDGLTVSS